MVSLEGEALRRTAARLGVQESYWDIWGREHHAADAVLAAIVEAIGANGAGLSAASPWKATLVTSDAEPWIEIGAHVVDDVAITAENGTVHRVECVEGRMRLPAQVGFGYHKYTAGDRAGHWIHCPDRMYSPIPPEQRVAGIAISLYGLRSGRNWGCGDCTDLRNFCRWAARDAGAAFVALNPLHALANRSPYNVSPYLPASTFYRNYIYVDVEEVPEYGASKLAQRLRAECEPAIREAREAELVDYEKVARWKRFFLQLLYREFLRGSAERRAAFDRFRGNEGILLKRFAVYSALDEWIHRRNPDMWIWPDWPEPFRNPDSEEVRAFAQRHWKRVEFWEYVYWIVDEQVRAAHQAALEAGMAIGLYHDLALATDRCGSDLWAHRSFYVDGCRVGSPPDEFSPQGQDWSFPPPNSERHAADGYRLFAAAIRNNARHGGALRIDHVMRFFRLYWIPEGYSAKEGTFVRMPWRDLLHVLALESHRQRVMVIGEDLGTVEEYVREGLAAFGVLSYRLLYFEKREENKFKTPDQYPLDAVVSSTTHDLPTLAGYWLGRDIEARWKAGLLPDEDSYKGQMAARLEDKHRMIEIFHDLHLLPSGYPRDAAMSVELTGELHSAAIGFLSSARSRVFVLNQEDLTKETEQQNLPGSTWQYPNWTRKMRYSLEELNADPRVADFTRMLRAWLEKTGRLLA